jgi:hypothetical protein
MANKSKVLKFIVSSAWFVRFGPLHKQAAIPAPPTPARQMLEFLRLCWDTFSRLAIKQIATVQKICIFCFPQGLTSNPYRALIKSFLDPKIMTSQPFVA